MAVFAVYIEKEVSYHGAPQRFGNRYYYQTEPTQVFNDSAVAQQVIDAELPLLATEATIVGWRTWGPVDGPEFENVMRESGELNTPGQAVVDQALYREACLLIVWPLPRSQATNRRRWLRKFLRYSGPSGTDSRVAAGAERLDDSQRQSVLDVYANPVTVLSSAVDDLELCAENGDLPTGPPVVRPYLYTRQIGQ